MKIIKEEDRSASLKNYYKNREKRIKQMKKWVRANREKRRKYKRAYYKTKNGKEAVKRAVKKYEAKNREKKKAWAARNYIELQPCVKCGKEPTHRHHPDYDKPMEVVFLCPLHHKEVHNPV